MRVAVDAMGGDHAPAEIVAGAVEAARGLPNITQIILVGDETAVRRELGRNGPVPANVEVRHASETIGMGESPVQAIRKKKDSSMSRCFDFVKGGEAEAVVSAGNTGALVVAASLKLRTLENVQRPAIAAVMPTFKSPFVLIDAGANVDGDARLLCQFAAMGAVYIREIFGRKNPVVGLLSIGEEDTKGNETTKEAFKMLSESKLNFRGNVEGHDLFKGETDVIVCDGFMGNVVLKTSESAARTIASLLKREFSSSPVRIAGSLLLRGAFKSIKRQMDPETYGGALLLGVNGVCIKTHGTSSRRAVYHAIRVACESVHQHLNNLIVEEIKKNSF